MLYLGVELFSYAFTITALSDGFARLGQKNFRLSNSNSWQYWVNQLKVNPQEPLRWFLDAADFQNPDYPAHLFDLSGEFSTVYLVNHRALCNLRQFLYERLGTTNGRNNDLEMSFVLASANRIFTEHDLELIYPEHDDF